MTARCTKRGLYTVLVRGNFCALNLLASLILAGSFWGGPASANFRYTFFEAAYVFGDYEFADTDIGLTGYEITGQYALSPGFVLGVRYLSLEGDETLATATGSNVLNFDSSGPDAYVLYHTPAGLKTDFILGARLDMRELEASAQNAFASVTRDEDTKYLFTGVRHLLGGLELQGLWSYNLDAEAGEDDWSYTISLLSGAPTGLQLGFQITPDDQGNIMGVSVRQSY